LERLDGNENEYRINDILYFYELIYIIKNSNFTAVFYIVHNSLSTIFFLIYNCEYSLNEELALR